MSKKIDELNITNVSQRENEFFTNGFHISFEIDGFRYRMYVEQGEDGLVVPRFMEHLDQSINCKYCETNSTVCMGVREYLGIGVCLDELFHRLIEFPSIRLEWLYINHV